MSGNQTTEMLSWVILATILALGALIMETSRFPEAWQVFQNGTQPVSVVER
jgi:hypothetical protein